MPPPLAVSMRGICKRYGAVQANDRVDLDVAAASVHAIVGENGAGKSTLVSILYGLQAADAGSIGVDGRPVRIAGTRHAIALGIGMVHQHFMLVERLPALDNVMLGAEGHWLLAPARERVRGRLDALMRDTGLDVRLDRDVEELPVGERQRLEILKALHRGARILILDEPTAVLTPQERGRLFSTLRTLRARGTTILLITHKLDEVAALADTVSVMRGGRRVLDAPVAGITLDALAEAMVGRRVRVGTTAAGSAAPGPLPNPAASAPAAGERGETAPCLAPRQRGAASGAAASAPPAVAAAVPVPASPAPAHGREAAPPLLAARGLRWRDALGVARLDGVSLELRGGEIVGVAGVAGNGQSELLDVLAGLLEPHEGSLAVGGTRCTPAHWLDPRRARALGVAHVPEDRQRRGLVLPFVAWESAVLGHHAQPRYCGVFGWMRHAAMRGATAALLDAWDVRPRDVERRTSQFSGGNQQKLVVAREAGELPRVLLAGQPTRGVDIGAIEVIHAALRGLRDDGGGVLLVSSDLDEILALADRVLVMHRGRIAGELPIGRCSAAALGRLMGGADESCDRPDGGPCGADEPGNGSDRASAGADEARHGDDEASARADEAGHGDDKASARADHARHGAGRREGTA